MFSISPRKYSWSSVSFSFEVGIKEVVLACVPDSSIPEIKLITHHYLTLNELIKSHTDQIR